MSDHVINATDQNFDDEVLKSDKPVLVDFWASWCAPCKAMAPVLEDLASEYGDKLKVVKLEVTENADTAAKYAIRNIPALILFKNGAPVAQQIGATPKSQLVNFVDQNISTDSKAATDTTATPAAATPDTTATTTKTDSTTAPTETK